MVSVEIKIVATQVSDGYARYHGKTVDKSLDGSFWDTQEDAIIKTTARAFTHTQTVQLAEGPHYVIYGNSAATGYLWHAQIFIAGKLVAEGDITRDNQLKADFTIGIPPTEECSVIFTAVDELGNPLEGASVGLNGLSGTTDHQGTLLFAGLALKTYGWSVSLAGYVAESGQVECTEAVTYGVQVTLRAVTPTPPLAESLLLAIGSAVTGIVLVGLCLIKPGR